MPLESSLQATTALGLIGPDPDWLLPQGLPASVGAVMNTRAAGVSLGAFAGLNLRPPELPGLDVDVPEAVEANRRRFAQALEGAQLVFLNQVHGVDVVRLTAEHGLACAAGCQPLPVADASYTTEPGLACTVLVADCLPVLFATADGQGVAAAHAGWRGLAAGVLEATLRALCKATGAAPAQVHAWLGACIGPQRFEVGDEVRAAFVANGGPGTCFVPTGTPGKWWANLPDLARHRLMRAGVQHLSGGQWCTASDPSRFFSFRRDRVTGRHAAAIWRR